MTVPLDSRDVAVWLFDEQHVSVHPVDAVGNLADLEVDSTLTRPNVVTWTEGFAREFADTLSTGFEVVDTNDDLLLTGNVSIVALMTFDNAAQDTAATPGNIISRGRDTELTPFGVRLTTISPGTDQVRIQMFWEDSAGAAVVDAGVLIIWPDDEEFLIAAIREQEGDEFICRYVVNGGTLNGGTHPLDVGGTSGSSVFIGVEPTGASAYVNHLCGDIITLTVKDEAVAVEEVQEAFRGMIEDGPRATTAIKGLLPPGPYSNDPESYIQRELDIEGAALGAVRTAARRRRTFPDQASGDHLIEWESITGRRRRASDSIDQRQARVVDYLQLHPGLESDDICGELLDPLGYTVTTDIDKLLYSVDHTQDFSTSSTPGADEAVIDEGNATFTVAAARLELDAVAQNLLFDPSVSQAPFHLWSFTDSLDVFFGGQVRRNAVPTADDVLIGFQIGSRQLNDWLFVGIVFDGFIYNITSARYEDGVLGSFATIAAGAASADHSFRFRHRGEGAYDLQWGISDAAAQAQTPTVIAGPADPLWAGFAAIASVSSNVDVDYSFDDWYSHEANGTHGLSYHFYRDPADAGAYDVGVAQDLVQSIGHAHYDGFVTDETQLLCDNQGGCDREPMGL